MMSHSTNSFPIDLYRFTHSHGWQKLTGLTAIPSPDVIVLPEVKIRVWLKKRNDKHVTMIRRDTKVKITSDTTTLVFVFESEEPAIEFCDACVVATPEMAMLPMMDPELQRSAERERGNNTLAYVANLLTDATFREFAQDLEAAIDSTDDGRALMDSFVQSLSRRTPPHHDM